MAPCGLWRMGDILMTYKEEIIKSMKYLADNDKTIFIGYNISYGSQIYDTMKEIPESKKIEFPIAEDMQMGVSIGLAMEGYIPVTVYERMDFLILALNQLVNHLDKIEEMSKGVFKPKVIVRTIVGAKKPLNPGLQHSQDHTSLLVTCLKNVDIYRLGNTTDVIEYYKKAAESDRSSILIEYKEYYEKA